MIKHFKISEFACKCGCGTNLISSNFVQKLDNLREVFGRPMIISSGYRCPKHNLEVSHTGEAGPHTTGRAADILIARGECFHLLELAFRSVNFTGYGLNQKGTSRYVHLDDLPDAPGQPRPTVWTY